MATKTETRVVEMVTLEFSSEDLSMLEDALKYWCINNPENFSEQEMWQYDNLLDTLVSS